MKKLSLLIFSIFTTVTTLAQVSATDSTSVETDVKEIADTITQKVETPPARNFGYLSYDEAIKAMPEYAQAQKSLEKLKEYYDKEMERAEQEFTKKFSEYIDGYRSFPENIMLKRQKELQQLMEQSMTFKNEAKQLLNKSEKELMEPLYKKLNNILNIIGTEYNLNYILNTDGNTYLFINKTNGEGMDITDIVIKQMSY